MRILLVDDDAPTVEALRLLLERAGHRVTTAENGREALERLQEPERCCVILLDLMMPVMNGYEFRQEQLKDPSLAAIPVIIVTADARAKERAQQLGSELFLLKPFSPPVLLEAIGRFCPPAA